MNTNRMNGIYTILISFLILLITGCSDFLDEIPDNRTVIDSKKKVAQLLTGAYTDAQYAEFAEAMSDNADDKGFGANRGDHPVNEKAYKWEDHTSEIQRETTSFYWSGGYRAIAHANQALEAIEALGGGSELDQYKGEALVARAYAHFMLVNLFSARYDPITATSELGVPYVTEAETSAIKNYKRETIGETYRLIEKDLKEGFRLVGNKYEEPKFHFTEDASRAFATRFYLYKGKWEKVVENANVVFNNENPAFLIRNLVSSSFRSLSYDGYSVGYSSSSEDANLLIGWVSSLYGRKFRFDSFRYGLSSSKADSLFDKVGNPFSKDWGYRVFGTTLSFNIPKYQEYFRITNVAQGIGFPYASVVHFTMDEVLLNRAEAYAMMGDNANALADLTIFLSRKTIDYDSRTDELTLDLLKSTFPNAKNEYDPSYPLNEDQAALVKAIAEFRRREFYHEGHRWFDIKRFNLVVEHKIDGQENPIILGKDDLRRVIQIPKSAQTFGIKANDRQ